MALEANVSYGSVPHGRYARRAVVEFGIVPGGFDLVILSDVIHHVPVPLREEILAAVRTCVAPGGVFLFKDWKRTATPIHWLCHAGDRWLTGDRVSYITKPQAESMLMRAFGRPAEAEAWVRPWRNNFALLTRA